MYKKTKFFSMEEYKYSDNYTKTIDSHRKKG